MYTGGDRMKITTQRIIEKFPMLEEKLKACESVGEGDLQSLLPLERTFLELACFFENPGEFHFDLALLYKNLDNDWLEWTLELITQFFREDTILIQNPSFSIIKDGNDYLSQSQFAQFLTERGLKYDRQKVNLYYERGKIPQPDLRVGGIRYWGRSTAVKYLEQEMKRL